MSSIRRFLPLLILAAMPIAFCAIAWAHPDHATKTSGDTPGSVTIDTTEKFATCEVPQKSSRGVVLVTSLTVFVLAIFVGFEIIAKVPPTLHTPLMSGSNAISGITVVGAIIAAGYHETDLATVMGFIAVILANINVVGGFLVTHRMLLMFKKR